MRFPPPSRRYSAISVIVLTLDAAALEELTAVPQAVWRQEVSELRAYFRGFGTRLPAALVAELDTLARRLG